MLALCTVINSGSAVNFTKLLSIININQKFLVLHFDPTSPLLLCISLFQSIEKMIQNNGMELVMFLLFKHECSKKESFDQCTIGPNLLYAPTLFDAENAAALLSQKCFCTKKVSNSKGVYRRRDLTNEIITGSLAIMSYSQVSHNEHPTFEIWSKTMQTFLNEKKINSNHFKSVNIALST